MARLRFVQVMIALLIMAYAFALAVSTAHLSQLYRVYDGGLPAYVSMGLAVALEIVAFLLSIISTSLGRLAGNWAPTGATLALILVWAGNGYAMFKAAPDEPLIVTLFASCFVPVSTFIVGKVLGGLFTLAQNPELLKEDRNTQLTRRPEARGDASHAQSEGPNFPHEGQETATLKSRESDSKTRPPETRHLEISSASSPETLKPESEAEINPRQAGDWAAITETRTEWPTQSKPAGAPTGAENPHSVSESTFSEHTETPSPSRKNNVNNSESTIDEKITSDERVNTAHEAAAGQGEAAAVSRETQSQKRRIPAREVIINHLTMQPRTAAELAGLMRAPLTNIERELRMLEEQVEQRGEHYSLKKQFVESPA